MPDLIRHPEGRPDESREPSQRLGPGFHREPWIPAFAGMTILIEMVVYKQTLIIKANGEYKCEGIFLNFGH